MTDAITHAGPDEFRTALARFPSGVTIVTTRDEAGAPSGFTASAFTSVSLEPPLVLVCLDRNANCHPAFEVARRYAVNILTPGHEELARRFATKDADKYAGAGFATDDEGPPVLLDAAAVLWCDAERVMPTGDHTILIGRVTHVRVGGDDPVVYYRGAFLAPR